MNADGAPDRAPMPADVEAPDKVFYGLTFRQLAILAVAALTLTAGYHVTHRWIPSPLLLAAGLLTTAVTLAIALGRRDGLPFDVWLLHGLRYSRSSRAMSTVGTATPAPSWVDPPDARMTLPAPLRLPATAVTDDGEITLGTDTTAIVAATTVNLALRTGDEQAALIDTFGRWLNSLSTATQIVVSAQPVDLASHADAVAARAGDLPHAALGDACAGHAAFLADLAARRDPLHRQVLIAARAPIPGRHAARRHADDTVRALSGLGVIAKTLDGAAVTAALAGCADPYRPPRPAGIAPADTVITTAPTRRKKV